MKKKEPKKRVLKITLTAIWRGKSLTETSSMSMGMLATLSPKAQREMVAEMKEHFRASMEEDSCLHPDMKLSVTSKVTSLEVDYFLHD